MASPAPRASWASFQAGLSSLPRVRAGTEPTVRKCFTAFSVLQALPLHRSNSCGRGPAYGRAGLRMRFSLLEAPGGCRSAQGPTAIAALTGCPEPQGPLSAPEGHPRAGSAPGMPCCAGEDPAYLCLPSDPPGGQTPRVGFGGTTAPAPPRRVGRHCPAPKGSTPTHPLLPRPSWLFSFATHFIILNVQCLSVLGMWTESPRHLLRRSQPLVVILEFTPVLLTWAASRPGTRRWRPSNRSPCAAGGTARTQVSRGRRVAGGGVPRCQKQTRLR